MIIGRLGRDPELRYTQNGTPVTSLNVATDESYIDREGVRQERTEWHRVSVFQKQAELCSNYLHKGSLVYVEGSLQTRKWTDQNGNERYTTEIKAQRVQFLDRRNNNSNNNQGDGGDGYRNDGYRNDYRNDGARQGGQSWGGSESRSPVRARSAQADKKADFPDAADVPAGAKDGADMDEVPF